MSLKGSFISYGIALGVNRMASFLLLPLMTAALKPEAFGLLSLIQLLYMLSVSFAVHGLDEAAVRFASINGERRIAKLLVKETLLFALISFPILIIFSMLTGTGMALSPAIFSALFLWIIVDSQFLPIIAYFRAKGEHFLVTASLITQGAFVWLFTWQALSIFEGSIAGILFANSAATAIPLVVLLIKLFAIKPDAASSGELITSAVFLKNIRSFAWLSCLVAILYSAISFGDRFIITQINGAHDTGLFSAAQKLAMVVALTLGAFRMAWYPVIYRALEAGNTTNNGKIISKAILTFGIAAISVSLFRNQIASFTFWGKSVIAPEYHSALGLVPLIALSVVFDGAATLADARLYFDKRMWLVAKISMATLAVKVLSGLFLTLQWGIKGAAVSLSLAFLFQTVCIEIANKKIYGNCLLTGFHRVLLVIVSLIITVINYTI